MDMESANRHCAKGLGIWDWASSDLGHEPDVVLACAGDTPTLEALAATAMLQEHFPDLKRRFLSGAENFMAVSG
jgi:xylulose-5-phosphate/fructose-6-phosphate phosphoketolase